MPTYVALLRGINVGKANRVPMADLRALLSELGYADVATLLNSGNAVFRTARRTPEKLAAAISKAIACRLHVDVPVVVKSAREFAAIVEENSLASHAADHSRLLVAFVQEPESLAALAAIESLVSPPEQFLLGSSAAYLHCVNGILESQAANSLLGKAGKATTTRNWATVLKLQTLVKKSETSVSF